MLKILKNASQIVTVNSQGKGFKRGIEQQELDVLYNSDIIIENGIIKDIVPIGTNVAADEIIDVSNKTILPGLVECHTHTVFAGSRSNEFRLKLEGATYEDIAKAGGGINATVTAISEISENELFRLSIPKVNYFISQGITTLEIKSGYGLSFDNEIKILNVIKKLSEVLPINIISTFLGAHTYPKQYKSDHNSYLEEITNKMLPYVAENKLAILCDAFCESTAFSKDEVSFVFKRATELGLGLVLHTEQFNNIGGIDLADEFNIFNVNHLEVVTKEDSLKLGGKETVAVVLPGVSFYLRYGYAPARELIDNNVIVAIGSDYNPGSCNIANISLIMSLAALNMKLNPEEIITGYTLNAAKAMNVSNKVGSIEINKMADFAIFDTDDYMDIIYNTGKNLNIATIKNGNIIYNGGLI